MSAAVTVAALACGSVACIGSGDGRCSAGEDYDNGFCLCEPPRMRDEQGRCMEAEVVDAGSSEGGPVSDDGYGETCASDADCADFEYNQSCQEAPSGESYCTHQGCGSDADCAGDSFCLTTADEPYCKRFPTGLGKTCASDADCAGQDAALCTVGAPGGATCAEEGCTSDADCPPDTVCNDFTEFVPDAPIFCGESIL